VLLTPAHAGRHWTQRELQANTAGATARDKPSSLGLINKVVRHLRDEGFVAPSEGRSRRIHVRDPLRLLVAWRDAYRFDRNERLSWFTLLKGVELAKALRRTELDAGGFAAYAAFSAAERQAPHVRQPKTWLYVAAQHLRDLATHAQAKEVESGENLVVLIPEDSGVFASFEPETLVGEQLMHCTDPVQTWIDLHHCGGRGEEAAQAVLEQRVLPAWRAVSGA
jgi:hypothetical protein